ncbi:MAG: TMEM43 family protein [Xanthobacteraceae bacterium]
MPDSFVETTSTSWLSRIVQSITGVLFGIVFVIGSIVLLFWNEGRAVQTARSISEGGKVVVEAAPAPVDPSNEGKLIHVSGDAKAGAPISDRAFGVSATALHLVRVAEMYQWEEDKHQETHKSVGGSEQTVTTYTYKKVWSDRAIDSQTFRHPDGHANPQKQYGRLSLAAADATLGAFKLGAAVLNLLPTSAALQLDPQAADALKPRIPNAQIVDGKIYIGPNADSPQIGDYKISYVYAPVGPVSSIGRQSGSGIAPYQTKAGDSLLLAVPGEQSAAEMFKQAERDNMILTWVLRLGGVLAMWLGTFLVLRPLVVVADVVPLIGSLIGAGAGLVALAFTMVVAGFVIALAWFWYRPLVGLAVLAAGLIAGIALHRLAGRRSATPARAAAA